MKALLKTMQGRAAAVVISVLLGACSSPEFKLSDGSDIKLDAYSGQWLLVNYWAIWCKPCIEEIPELNALHQTEGYQVLGYNFDRASGDELKKQVEQLGIAFPLLAHEPASMFEQPQPPALPATMVVSPDGEFHSWLMGPQTREGILQKLR